MQKREFLAQFQGPGGLFQMRCARSKAQRAFHWPRPVPDGSNCPSGVPDALKRVPGADNRTEIISPANEQYKGRKSLAAVPKARRAVPGARRPFQVEPKALFQGPEGVPEAKGSSRGQRQFQKARRAFHWPRAVPDSSK